MKNRSKGELLTVSPTGILWMASSHVAVPARIVVAPLGRTGPGNN